MFKFKKQVRVKDSIPVWLFVICYLLFIVPSTHAARFVVEQPKDEKTTPYTANVYFEPEGESVNALSGEISIPGGFNPDVRAGDSIILLWVDAPVYDAVKKKLSFGGAIPNGYPGQKGLVFRLIFDKVSSAKDMKVSGTAYLNDGNGTAVKLSPSNFEYKADIIAPDIKTDRELPEPFVPFIERDPVLFDGKPALVFTTQDKNSGIDHYELGMREPTFFFAGETVWSPVTPPHVFTENYDRQYIYVKAVDRNGNERIEKISPEKWYFAYKNYLGWGILVLILLVVPLFIRAIAR